MEVPIKNKRIITILDDVLNRLQSLCEKHDIDIQNTVETDFTKEVRGKTGKEVEEFCSEEFLREHFWKDYYKSHIGFPTQFKMVALEKFKTYSPEFLDFWEYLKFGLVMELGTSSNALMSLYPSDGLTGWHTNWNANAYQFLFTWSENGDGFFRYKKKKKDEMVTIQDKPGWQCRWYYFAKENEPEDHCWHCCYNRTGTRLTLAFKVQNELSDKKGKYSKDDPVAQLLRDEFAAEISRDE